MVEIQAIQAKHRYTYGVKRVTAELKRRGFTANHKRVERLMKANNLNAIIRAKRNYRCSVKQEPRANLPGNVLDRNFTATQFGEKLVSDVTYLPVKDGGWCYVSLVKDLCTSLIVACAMSRSQNMDLAFEALRQLKEVPTNGLFHTDQGFMYTNQAFAVELEKMGLQQSLSRRTNCWDNAVIESFNGSMKCEWFYPYYKKNRWNLSFEELCDKVNEYVRYYNEERIQEKLSYLTPMEYHHRVTQSNY